MLSILALIPLLFSPANAGPVKRWPSNYSIGANFFQTNGFNGNQLVASYILHDGSLSAGSAPWTGGNGSAGINDPSPLENHADPFYSSGSVIVSKEQVFVTNAGSNSFSVFEIDPSDPAQPTWAATYPSNGEFPTSLAASPDGNTVCVLNAGAKNGFSCYQSGGDGWSHISSWDRSLGLNLTTPPHGPVGNTPSQIIFNKAQSAVIVVVKGQLPTDLNNPSGEMQGGYVATYAISANGSLAQTPVKTAAAVPFSINEDLSQSGVYFMSDVTTGYAGYKNGSVVQGTVANESATCWAAQSPRSNSFYVVDIGGKSNITEISLDTANLNGTIVSAHSLGVNASGTDNSVFSGKHYDWMYVNAPGYHSVHTYKIESAGKWELVQRYMLHDMSNDVVSTNGFAGQAVYYKN